MYKTWVSGIGVGQIVGINLLLEKFDTFVVQIDVSPWEGLGSMW